MGIVVGIIMAGYAFLVRQGMLDGVLKTLHASKMAGEIVTMGYVFGAIGIAVGLWQLFASPTNSSPPSAAQRRFCCACLWSSAAQSRC